MPPWAPRQTPKHTSKAVSCAPTDLPLLLRLCKPACAGGQGEGRFPQQPLCCTSPGHLPHRSIIAACQVAIITSAYERLWIPGAHFTDTLQSMVQTAPDQVQPIRAFRAPECEDEWRKGDFQQCWKHSGRPQQMMHWHTRPPGNQAIPRTQKCAGGDQPTQPAVKYSLGTGENKRQQLYALAPVKLNRMATAKERVLVAWPKDPLSKNTPTSTICCGIWTAVSFTCGNDSQLFEKVLQCTLKIVRHCLKGSVCIAALSED